MDPTHLQVGSTVLPFTMLRFCCQAVDGYLAGLHLRASMIWIKDLTRTTH
ncbi:hypothetical protein ACIP4U_34020 [Streptomyces caelestis]|uniref:Uncharacterized protein n=1 Tax=Streptomyces caelestis TaxID=36816 RepID=A0A7W9LQ66_9ACTN|nr:hypothetical protein [Streptomyces caelestis]MBB5792115.1 hypothetical protein [Streptomyces caelestis]